MAQAICMQEMGVSAELFFADSFPLQRAGAYDAFALGCPAMRAEVLEEGTFEPFFVALEPKLAGGDVALFGSYGWDDGVWMRDWEHRVRQVGARLFREERILQDAPGEAGEAQFGAAFVQRK